MTTADRWMICMVVIPALGFFAGLFWAKPLPPPKPGFLYPDEVTSWEEARRRWKVRTNIITAITMAPIAAWLVLHALRKI